MNYRYAQGFNRKHENNEESFKRRNLQGWKIWKIHFLRQIADNCKEKVNQREDVARKFLNWSVERKTVGKKKEWKLSDLWDSVRWFNTHVISVSGKGKRSRNKFWRKWILSWIVENSKHRFRNLSELQAG